MGSSAGRYAQSKIEAVWGTQVAATARWMGLEDIGITIIPTVAKARFLRGDSAPAHQLSLNRRTATVKLNGLALAEDILMVLDSAVKGSVAGVNGGDTTDYSWTYAFPNVGTAAGQRSRTLELYDGTTEYELSGAICGGFELRGSEGADGLVKLTSDWVGKSGDPASVTGGLTARTVDAFPTSGVLLYIDDSTMGSTVKSDALIDWSFKATNGAHVKNFQGNLVPSSYGFREWDMSLNYTLEAGAIAAAEVVKAQAGTLRLVRIKCVSTTLAGALTVYKSLTIEMPCKYTGPIAHWGDRDGNTTVPFSLTPVYDPTYGGYCQIVVVNKLSTHIDA